MNRNEFLRVKLKSLAAESKIINIEEKRANKRFNFDLQNRLRKHRTGIVRREARHTLLAYQFLSSVPYEKVERQDSRPVDWSIVLRMIQRYGNKKYNEEHLRDWYKSSKIKAQL